MGTKYDWSEVDKDTQWITTDSNGDAEGHSQKPSMHPGYWVMEQALNRSSFFLSEANNPYKGDWRDSLEQRPGGE